MYFLIDTVSFQISNFILFIKKKKEKYWSYSLKIGRFFNSTSIRRRCAIRNFPFPVSNVCFFPLAYFEGRCLPLKLQNLNVKAIQRMANGRIIKMGGRVWYCCLEAFLWFLFFFLSSDWFTLFVGFRRRDDTNWKYEKNRIIESLLAFLYLRFLRYD